MRFGEELLDDRGLGCSASIGRDSAIPMPIRTRASRAWATTCVSSPRRSAGLCPSWRTRRARRSRWRRRSPGQGAGWCSSHRSTRSPTRRRPLSCPDRCTSSSRPSAADPEEAAARFAGFSAESFFDFVLGDHPGSDAAVFGDVGFRALFRAALDEGFRRGSGGYAHDTVLAMQPWRLDLDAIDVPVTILFGADDATHSPDLGATLAARITAAERIVVPGVGGSLLWARPELVLDAAFAEPTRLRA
jgi:pimeloyl-ACP methyl ester carboxylesterase